MTADTRTQEPEEAAHCCWYTGPIKGMGMDFLSQIVTGGELWVHHFEPGIKQQSIEWQRTILP